MGFREWRAKRKARKEEKRNPYDKEELRILTRMAGLEPGTEAYKEAQAELKTINQTRAESRESKRRISKQDKGSIVVKTLGIIGGAAGLLTVIKAERDGLTFTGEKRTVMDSICRAIGNCFHR